MLDTKLPGANPDHEGLSRRNFLLGIAVASAVALPVLSAPARAAVSMLHTGLDPELVKPESEIVRVGRGGGGRGGGGRGGGGRGGGRGHGGHGRGHGGHGRGHAGRGRGHGGRGHGHGGRGHRHGGRGHRHGHGGRWWHGRYWGYGVGSCWRWTPAGYIWICGY
jgi:hypothetical protein